ncbi:MAG: hypothetical protein Q4E36_03375 [Bacillota bacterium]|nr:hypothetical protein [Bacillota bacterium]
MVDTPGYGFYFIYYYDGELTHFFPEGTSLDAYLENIDDPRYTPVEGTFNYYGDGLNMIDQPAHVIIKEVSKKRGYIS